MNNTKSKVNKETLRLNLKQFRGSNRREPYSPSFPKMYMTEGVKYLAEHGYYPLLHYIASRQEVPAIAKDPMLQEIQFWRLEVREDRSATLLCERDRHDAVFRQEIGYTDSILDLVKVWVQPLHLSPYDYNKEGKRIFLLPDEY